MRECYEGLDGGGGVLAAGGRMKATSITAVALVASFIFICSSLIQTYRDRYTVLPNVASCRLTRRLFCDTIRKLFL